MIFFSFNDSFRKGLIQQYYTTGIIITSEYLTTLDNIPNVFVLPPVSHSEILMPRVSIWRGEVGRRWHHEGRDCPQRRSASLSGASESNSSLTLREGSLDRRPHLKKEALPRHQMGWNPSSHNCGKQVHAVSKLPSFHLLQQPKHRSLPNLSQLLQLVRPQPWESYSISPSALSPHSGCQNAWGLGEYGIYLSSG